MGAPSFGHGVSKISAVAIGALTHFLCVSPGEGHFFRRENLSPPRHERHTPRGSQTPPLSMYQRAHASYHPTAALRDEGHAQRIKRAVFPVPRLSSAALLRAQVTPLLGELSALAADPSHVKVDSCGEILDAVYALGLGALVGMALVVPVLGLAAWMPCCDRSGQEHDETPSPRRSVAQGDCPRVIRYFAYVTNVLVYVSNMVFLPTSHEVTWASGGTTESSGLVIGAYGIGFLIGLPIFYQFAKPGDIASRVVFAYRWGHLFFAFVFILGNGMLVFCIHDHGQWFGVWGLVAARMVTGLESGILLVSQTMILKFTAEELRSANIAKTGMATGVGIILGPLLSSLCHLVWTDLFPGTAASGPFLILIPIGVAYGVAVCCFFPSNEACFTLVGLSLKPIVANEDAALESATPKWRVLAACLACMMEWTSTVLRFTKKVAWEASAAFVLAEQYHYGSTISGFLLAGTIVGYVCLGQPSFIFLSTRLSAMGLARVLNLMEGLGLLVMFRPAIVAPESQWKWCAAFLAGSLLFYSGNMMQGAVYGPLRASVQIPTHPYLNLETGTLFFMVSICVGYFLGPVLSRALLARCLHQNIFTGAAMGLFVIQLATSEVVLRRLVPYLEREALKPEPKRSVLPSPDGIYSYNPSPRPPT